HPEEILDVRRLEEFQAAVLHERHLALGELHFEDVAVARAAEQDCLALERHARLALLQHLGANKLRLSLQISYGHHARPRTLAADRQQVLAELAWGLRHDAMGDI